MMQILIFIAASSLFLSFHQGEINCQLLQPDNRCFLEDGGSTLTFFIKEDLTVGQQIGRLNIKGTVGRDIDLSVKDINGLYDQLPVELEGKINDLRNDLKMTLITLDLLDNDSKMNGELFRNNTGMTRERLSDSRMIWE